ncbi:MAG: cytochrome c3 family protein [Planctomycetota bacterium]|jgi:nitrate/TMAO reductase-like tetraheme cytochrome c subunit
MRKKLILAGIIAVVFLGISLGAVSYTSRDDFCGKCHPVLIKEFRDTLHHAPKAEDKERAGCIDCHAEPGLMSMMYVKIKGLRDLEETAMLSPDDPKTPRPAHVTDEVCAKCHEDIIESMHGSAMDPETGDIKEGILPPDTRLAQIGMNMNGTLHLDDELKASCAECHDEELNFLKKDPMSCTSCHWNVAHNPTSTSMFTERRSYTSSNYNRNIPAMIQVCGRCHNGKTHGNGQWPSPEAREKYGRVTMANVFLYERLHGALAGFERENVDKTPQELGRLLVERRPELLEEVKAQCSGCHANLWDWETTKREKRKGFRIDRYFLPVGKRNNE